MHQPPDPPPPRAAVWSPRLAWFALVLLAIAGAAHRFAVLETVAFIGVMAIAGGVALAGLLLSLAAFARIWEEGAPGGGRAFAGLVLAVIALAPFGVGGWRMVEHPRLNDVATDLSDPPVFRAAGTLRGPDANAIRPITAEEAERIAEAYPEVTGRRYALSPERVVEAATALMAARGWSVFERRGRPDADPEVSIEALAPSYIFGFPSDVVLRVTDEGEASFVDMRSASHYGAHDLGDNAIRIMRFLADLDAAVAALAESG